MNHTGTKPLETERLMLRKFALSDAEDAYQNWTRDPEVCRFWRWSPHASIEETKACISSWVAEYISADYYHWVITLKRTRCAIGYIYLSDIDDAASSVSVHYALSRSCWNQGIMTEACGRVIKFAFSELRARTVRSWHHADNPASGKVLVKCGMKHIVTEKRSIPECPRISGDYLIYEITAAPPRGID